MSIVREGTFFLLRLLGWRGWMVLVGGYDFGQEDGDFANDRRD